MRKILPGFLMLFLLFGCGENASPKNKITVGLGYIENIQFAPFYIAKEQGYFRAQGFDDVELVHGISPDLIMNVGAGTFDFAISDGDEIIKATEQTNPVPIEPVFTLYKKLPVALVSLSDTPLNSLEDVRGKKIGIPGEYGSSYDSLLVALQSVGIKKEELDLQSIGYTQIEQLLNKSIDIAVCFVNNEPVKLKSMGQEINVLVLSDYIDLVSATIITSKEKFATDPQRIERFTIAVQQGMKFCFEHPTEAVALSYEQGYIPLVSPEEKAYSEQVLRASMQLWGEQASFGSMDTTQWQQSIQALRAVGVIQ